MGRQDDIRELARQAGHHGDLSAQVVKEIDQRLSLAYLDVVMDSKEQQDGKA